MANKIKLRLKNPYDIHRYKYKNVMEDLVCLLCDSGHDYLFDKKYTIRSWGCSNDNAHTCPICLEIPKRMDNIGNYKDEIERGPYYKFEFDLGCTHQYCPECLNRLAQDFLENPRLGRFVDLSSGEEFIKPDDNHFPCPICRRNISGMLKEYLEYYQPYREDVPQIINEYHQSLQEMFDFID